MNKVVFTKMVCSLEMHLGMTFFNLLVNNSNIILQMTLYTNIGCISFIFLAQSPFGINTKLISFIKLELLKPLKKRIVDIRTIHMPKPTRQP